MPKCDVPVADGATGTQRPPGADRTRASGLLVGPRPDNLYEVVRAGRRATDSPARYRGRGAANDGPKGTPSVGNEVVHMKLSLVVVSQGKSEGKAIPITLSQFVIGRDPQCHLRPVSAAISKRHCAILVRGTQVFVRDFESTNGTFVNEEPVKGERELHNEDSLKVGPLQFKVKLEVTAPAPVSKPTPPPAPRAGVEASDDDSVAAMLLAIKDDEPLGSVDSQGVPTGSTIMDVSAAAMEGTTEQAATKPDDKKQQAAAKAATGNTSTAAKAILEKYMRRPRG